MIDTLNLIGMVGGVSRLHPFGQIDLRLLGVKTGTELAGVVASVGLAQNLARLESRKRITESDVDKILAQFGKTIYYAF